MIEIDGGITRKLMIPGSGQDNIKIKIFNGADNKSKKKQTGDTEIKITVIKKIR